MRNYVQIFFMKMDFDDQFMSHFTTYTLEPSLDDIILEIQAETEDLTANGYQNIVPTILGTRYFTLDKANLARILGLNAELFWILPGVFGQFAGDGTPRDGWTDIDGIKRAPPPSDKPSKTAKKPGEGTMSLLTYLKLLLDNWQSGSGAAAGIGPSVPKRWIDWLELLISHYSRYTPVEIYAFLARVDFSAKTFRV